MHGMLQIFLNDIPQELGQEPTTWGELLDMLDIKAANDGKILSAARFDGVEEPAFREPNVIGRALIGVSRVDVETAVPAAFLRDCLLEAIGPLEASAHAAQELAALYRDHELTRGHEGLVQLAGDIRSLTMLIGMLAGIGVEMGCDDIVPLEATLDSLVSAQVAEDWLTVADILEYDLEPAMRRWAAVLTRITDDLNQ